MVDMLAKDISATLKSVYEREFASNQIFIKSCNGCEKFYRREFGSKREAESAHIMSMLNFVSVSSMFFYQPKRMTEFLSVCNPWVIWCFNRAIHRAISLLDKQHFTYECSESEKILFKKYSVFSFPDTGKRKRPC